MGIFTSSLSLEQPHFEINSHQFYHLRSENHLKIEVLCRENGNNDNQIYTCYVVNFTDHNKMENKYG